MSDSMGKLKWEKDGQEDVGGGGVGKVRSPPGEDDPLHPGVRSPVI